MAKETSASFEIKTEKVPWHDLRSVNGMMSMGDDLFRARRKGTTCTGVTVKETNKSGGRGMGTGNMKF